MNSEVCVKEQVLGLHHIGFFCSDLEETVKFYTEVLGFDLLYYADVEVANERLAMMKLGNTLVEALCINDSTSNELYDKALAVNTHIALIVSDIEKVKTKLLIHPRITFEEHEIRHTPNVGKMDNLVTFFRGLDGERIEILQDLNNDYQ